MTEYDTIEEARDGEKPWRDEGLMRELYQDKRMSPSEDRADKRAATPMGFARAVYLSHEREGYTLADSIGQQATLTEVA